MKKSEEGFPLNLKKDFAVDYENFMDEIFVRKGERRNDGKVRVGKMVASTPLFVQKVIDHVPQTLRQNKSKALL